MRETTIESFTTDTDGVRTMTIISCGKTKQTLTDGERVPARELYESSVHTCKDRFGRHSDEYYIMSAKFGLVHHNEPLPEYDQTLDEMSNHAVHEWGKDVANDIVRVIEQKDIDVVILIGGETYIEPILFQADRFDAAVLTPWQTVDEITGVGKGMGWCNNPEHYPTNTDPREIVEPRITPNEANAS